MLNLQQLTTYVTVINEGSMTAAADKLYLTQPAVSQQIRNLEEELGVELLVRGVRQIKPTPQGEILIEHARKMIHMAQQTEVAVRSIGAELTGYLRIGTLNSIGLHLMSPQVSRLMRHNPDLRLRIEYGSVLELFKQFQKNQIDVLVLPDLKKELNIEINAEMKNFMKEEMWLVSSGKDNEVPAQMQLSDLMEYAFVELVDEYQSFNEKLYQNIKKDKMKIIFESTNVGTLKRVIESGLGCGFLPSHSIKKQVRSGRLLRTHLSDFQYTFDIQFYYPKNSLQKKLIEVFYQTLLKND